MQSIKPYPTLVALAVMSLFAATPAQAQQASEEAKPAELKTVVVSASRSQAQVEAMPLNTTIVSQEDIQKSSAQTLDQLLRDVPGLNFTGVPAAQSDPTGHSTKMRGMGNAKVLVLLDGVPIHDPFYLTTQWFKVPLSGIERVEVVRGGNSSLWGNMAVAGVINIVSKRPTDNSGEASLSAGSNGTLSAAISKNIVLSDTLSVNLSIDKLNSRGYDTVLPEQKWRYPARQPVNTQNTNIQISTYFKPSADLNGYVRIGQHVQDQDISYVNGKNLQTDPDISASFTKTLDDKSAVTATAWAQYLEFEKYNGATCYWETACTSTTKTTDTTASIRPNVVQYYTQYGSQRYREQGASGIYSRSMSGLFNSLQLGVDYRHLSATDLEYFYGAPTLGKLQNLSSSTFGQAEQTFTGVFAQTKLVPTDALDITLSARFDSWDNTNRVNTRTMAGAATIGGAQPSSNTSAFNPSIAARYAFTDELALRGAAYKSFRAPGFNNTTRTFGSPNPTIANPDLTPENLFGREIGLDFNRGGLSLSATYFQYDIQNMIASYKVSDYATAPALVQLICGVNLMNCGGTPAPLKQGTANFYSNNQDGQSYGLELQAAWKLNRQWALDGTYTRTTSMLTRKGFVGGEPVGVQTTGVPQDVASLGATWKPGAAWQTHLQARYIGSMNIDTTSTAGVEYKQADITVWDASMLYKFSKSVDLSASVVNLLDTQYSENAYSYNQPWSRTLSMPRTVTLGMKMRF